MGQGLILFFFYGLFQIVMWIAGVLGYLLGFIIIGVQSVCRFVFKRIKTLFARDNDRQAN